MGDDASEYHSTGSQSDSKNDLPPESDNQDLGSKCSDHPEGEQYDPDDANEYLFSSDNDLERVYSRATQIIVMSALCRLDSQAAKAAKLTLPKAPVVESNRA